MLNAYGLTNAGVALGLPGLKEALDSGLNVIPNFYPEFARGTDTAIAQTLEAIGLYRAALGNAFKALELNFSCPNSDEEIRENVVQSLQCCQTVRRTYPDLRLIAKISICHPFEFAQELENLGVLAIHAVNTIPYALVFPPPQISPSPLAQVGGGGVSGGPAFAQAYTYNRELRQKVKVHLIMGCGVTSMGDAQRYFDVGADAVSICTLALRKPGEAERIVNHFCGLDRR
jgi:dihydroorotate dehydrogenase (NAD+) catalytic subunit